MKLSRFAQRFFAPSLLPLAVLASAPVLKAQGAYHQTNLVSDIPGEAAKTDLNLVNPWGISFSPTSPFWISDNGSGKSTLYRGNGTAIPLVVNIPGGAPTGTVFNGTGKFNGDIFVFASEAGTITGWRGPLGTSAETLFSGASGAVFKGLALGSIGGNSYLYASDFHNNDIQVFGSAGAPALTGNFMDPTLPSGFAPFNIQNLGGHLYVTYAKQDAVAHDDVAGPGNGFVDVFNLDGTFSTRLISGGWLNSPWGLAMAPGSFGMFANDLLVGNFGDGTIGAYNPTSGAYLGSLGDGLGGLIKIDGLWGLAFGNGSNGFDKGSLYFTAGIPGDGAIEDHGLLGSLTPVPEPGTGLAGALTVGVCACIWWRRRQARASTGTELAHDKALLG